MSSKAIKLTVRTPIPHTGLERFPENDRYRSSVRKVVLVQCADCGGQWRSDEREQHAKGCVAFALRRKEFPKSTMEWDLENPEGVLKRTSYSVAQQIIPHAKWKWNRGSGAVKQGPPRLRESIVGR